LRLDEPGNLLRKGLAVHDLGIFRALLILGLTIEVSIWLGYSAGQMPIFGRAGNYVVDGFNDDARATSPIWKIKGCIVRILIAVPLAYVLGARALEIIQRLIVIPASSKGLF